MQEYIFCFLKEIIPTVSPSLSLEYVGQFEAAMMMEESPESVCWSLKLFHLPFPSAQLAYRILLSLLR